MAALFQLLGRLGTGYAQARDTQTQEKNDLALKKAGLQERLAQLKSMDDYRTASLKLREFAANNKQGAGPVVQGPDGEYYQSFRDPEGNMSYQPFGKGMTPEPALGQNMTTERQGATHPPKVNFPQGGGPPESLTRWDPQQKKEITITPKSPLWSAEDQELWERAGGAHAAGQKEKEKLGQERAGAYARYHLYGASEVATGTPTFVTYDTFAKNPGKYGPPGPVQRIRDRWGMYNEITQSTDMLKEALSNMNDSDFGALSRAGVAAIVANPFPESAYQAWLQSDVAQGLSDAQLEYVAAVTNAQESALALRQMGGQSGSSNMVRSAVLGLLPGAVTPNKSVAALKLYMFDKEVAALMKSLPPESIVNMELPKQGADQTIPGLNVPKPPSP